MKKHNPLPGFAIDYGCQEIYGNCGPRGLDILKDINIVHLYKAFGGESKTELGHRVETFMKLLEDKGCESVAVFTHAGWLRAMLDEVIGVKIPRNHICCNNCTIAIFEYTGKLWRLHSWINTV